MLERIVVVRFKAVGNAPIMKQNFYKITAANRFQAVIQFLRKELGWKAGDPLVRTLQFFQAYYRQKPGPPYLASHSLHISIWHFRPHPMILYQTYTRHVFP